MQTLRAFARPCLTLLVFLAITNYSWAYDCTLEPMNNRTIIELGLPSLCSPIEVGTCIGQSDPVVLAPLLPSGIYDVTLQSHDDHSSKPGQVQLNESYFLRLLNPTDVTIVQTNAITDLPDGSDSVTQVVNSNLFVGDDVRSLIAIHACDDSTGNSCDVSPNSIVPVCVAFDLIETAVRDGRMTGGGSVAATSVRHGFEIHCDLSRPNTIEVNWRGNRFHMTSLDYANCTDAPNIHQAPPNAAFDTFTGHGTGRLNGVNGATMNFVFVDAGEPGAGTDSAMITIRDRYNNVMLDVFGLLKNGGNHQAH